MRDSSRESDRGCIVFVEVRYRGERPFATAANTVDRRKQQKLIRTAAWFLSRERHLATCPVRFDVVAVDAAKHGAPVIKWIRDAFRPT